MPEPIVTLVETPHPISPYIAQARETTTEALSGARGYVEEGVSKWIGFEKRVERESNRAWEELDDSLDKDHKLMIRRSKDSLASRREP